MPAEMPDDIDTALRLGGELGQLIRRYDWDHHPLGPMHTWSPTTRALVAMALTSRFPIVLWFQDPLFLIYNDAYGELLGEKHPHALGRPGREIWWEIWDVIGPMLHGVVESGVATWSDDQRLVLRRHGYPEECFFTFTYSPIVEADGAVNGVFCAVHETTERVLGERRLRTLRDLGSRLTDIQAVTEAADAAITVCSENVADLPFVALYLADAPGASSDVSFFAATNGAEQVLAEASISLDDWCEGEHRTSVVRVDDVGSRFPKLAAIADVGPLTEALVLPLVESATIAPIGWLVVGLTPLRPRDTQYETFCKLIAGQVASALTAARVLERERERSDALAALDHAKTEFFNNVSHEFRTPLTLLLGPLDNALAIAPDDPVLVADLEIAQRNAQRMLKLVNTLLDFSRIEAGRHTALFSPTDIGRLTADIASSFTELIERAGLKLTVTVDAIEAFVDVQRWETVVLNLLSNAFKFTLRGGIDVRVAAQDESAIEITVTDTGVGIDERDLPRLFERFYRAGTSQGRSYEGTGIGLALVRELVELHGGTIAIASTLGIGTTVTIVLPRGRAHLPASQVSTESCPVGLDRSAFIAEAQQWIADDIDNTDAAADGEQVAGPRRRLIVVADDNADMRRYLAATLEPYWDTAFASNGQTALELVRDRRPDLVITDIMMPELGGFDLVAAIRTDAELAPTPVIMLSARAGPEAASDGFDGGADDYLAKPFTSRDLISRVSAKLDAAHRHRRQRADDERAWQHTLTLGEYTAQLNEATSVDDILEATLGELGPRVGARYACIGVFDPVSNLIRLHHAGAMHPQLADRYYLVDADAPIPGAAAVRLDRTIDLGDPAAIAELYPAMADDAGESGLRAATFVPLHGDSADVLGVLILGWPAARELTPEQRTSIDTHAAIVARTLQRLQKSEWEHRIAAGFQERLLAVDFRSTAAAVCARYTPAVEPLHIGGDWYTADALDDSKRVAFSVGDVVGHGLGAAVAMSQLRSALRSAAITASEPDAVIDTVDRYTELVPDADCATVAYAVLDRDAETISYSCAGHPFPLLVTPDGSIEFLDEARRPPLGSGVHSAGATVAQHQFPAGALLVLYTDGLIERRGESLDAGFARLAAAAHRLRHEPVSLVCDALLQEMEPATGFTDDVAIVAVRPVGTTATTYVDALRATFDELTAARQRLRAWLEALGVPENDADDVLVAVGEAVNNAIIHGTREDHEHPVTVEAFLTADDTLVCSVSDFGRWSRDTTASRRASRGGLGLTILHGLMDSVDIRRHRFGTSVVLRRGLGTHDREQSAQH